MADEIAPPVKNILKAFELGVKLANKVSKSTADASPVQALQISESAQSLQRSLERSSIIITDSYKQHVASCGEPFGKTLEHDNELKQRFKNLRTDVRDRIDECEEFEDDPESFRATAFSSIEREAQNCADQCIIIFRDVRDRIVQGGPQDATVEAPPRDDRALLSSMRQRAPTIGLPVPSPSQNSLPTPAASPAASPSGNRLHLEISPAEPVKPRSPWIIESPSQFDLGSHMCPPPRSPKRNSRELSPRTTADAQGRLISSQVVQSRVRANEEFLARRRDSRMNFNEIRQSISSIDEHRVSDIFTASPILTPISMSASMPISPIDSRTSRTSMNDYQTLMTRERSKGEASQGTRSSVASSNYQDRPAARRSDSEDDSIFGLRAGPLSPAISEHRSSTGLETLATTLRLPGFGHGVEEGLEVVDTTDYGAEKIPVFDNEPPEMQPTSSASVRSIEHPMRHDTSFVKFGGFCEGARALIRGEDCYKTVKRPAGQYTATVSKRCIKCSYEVDLQVFINDMMLDRAGIYSNHGIRFRQRFISKSHLKSKSIEETCYACIFCVEEHRTVEEHDATVFFSVGQLFRHLATHQRPLYNVPGITALYGQIGPEVVDFDIYFPTSEPSLHEFSIKEIAQKVATRPKATAIITHRPKKGHGGSRDPTGGPVLNFAVGATIVGVTFPTEFGGTWCMGYHDGERGAFPASAISLELPSREDLIMNQASQLVATARWDFKPKDAKDTWLKFSKGDVITNIGYTFQDQWCWSGCTNKGKTWGLFPQAFVDHLHEADRLSSSPSGRNKFGFKKAPSFPVPRTPVSNNPMHRGASVRSTSSNGSNNMIQPGLEVVRSPIHGSPNGSWRG